MPYLINPQISVRDDPPYHAELVLYYSYYVVVVGLLNSSAAGDFFLEMPKHCTHFVALKSTLKPSKAYLKTQKPSKIAYIP